MARQELLTRTSPAPPQLWAVVDEAALRRPIGGPEVMRGQFDALLNATKLPNVQLQVVRTGTDGLSGLARGACKYSSAS